MGRHLPAAADRRLPHLGPAVGLPVGPVRLPGHRHGRAGLFAGSFIGLRCCRSNFPYWAFALLIAANGIGSGMFAAPNSSSIMGSVPARQRGAASGMRVHVPELRHGALDRGVLLADDRRAGQHSLPTTLTSGLQAQGVAPGVAQQLGDAAAGVVSVRRDAGRQSGGASAASRRALASLPAAHRARSLTGRDFFPRLLSAPFHQGLVVVFVAAALSVLAALASLLRGGRTLPSTATVPEISSTASGPETRPKQRPRAATERRTL